MSGIQIFYQIHDLQIFSPKEMAGSSVSCDKSATSPCFCGLLHAFSVCQCLIDVCIWGIGKYIEGKQHAYLMRLFSLFAPFQAFVLLVHFQSQALHLHLGFPGPVECQSQATVWFCCCPLLGNQIPFCLQSKYTAHVKMCSHLSHKRHV